jgi:aquaporin Z
MAKADVSDFGKKVYGSVDESLTYVTSSDKMYYGDLAPFASEFMGTFLLCFTVGLCAGVSAFAPLAIGASLMVSVFMGGHISGAHHNPAVTLAILTAGKMKTGMFQMGPAGCAAGYVTAQLLGSLVAGMFAYSISRDMDYNMGTPRVSRRASWTSAMSIEIIFTFFLALTVLNVATTRANEGNSFYGLAIGFMVFVAVQAAGPISGGAFNPAVGTGLPLMSGVHDSMDDIWIYWFGPLMGAFLAAIFFNFTVKED